MKRPRLILTLAGLSLSSLLLPSGPAQAQIGFGVSITIAPPALPVYVQPAMPAAGYMWSPGYWAWGDGDYYWVPGTWVMAPQPGVLWTPGYWGWSSGNYLWHEGYWGPHIGFYGGVNYGFGYVGTGYAGGYWQGGAFFYNRSVNNIPGNVHITNVYNKTVVNNVTVNQVSYNGGTGGTSVRPTSEETAAEHEKHLPPVAAQAQQQQVARANPSLRASANHGNPPVAATLHAGELSGPGIVPARGASAPAHPAATGPVHPVTTGPLHPVATAPVHPEATMPVHPSPTPPAAEFKAAAPPAAVASGNPPPKPKPPPPKPAHPPAPHPEEHRPEG